MLLKIQADSNYRISKRRVSHVTYLSFLAVSVCGQRTIVLQNLRKFLYKALYGCKYYNIRDSVSESPLISGEAFIMPYVALRQSTNWHCVCIMLNYKRR